VNWRIGEYFLLANSPVRQLASFLFINDNLLHDLILAVFKDHGINASWHGSQIDYFLE
jgi:hypothetical protein